MEEVTTEVEQVTEVESKNLFVPHRLEGETFEQYKERRLVANYKAKQITRGRMIWNSRPDTKQKGVTYRKEK